MPFPIQYGFVAEPLRSRHQTAKFGDVAGERGTGTAEGGQTGVQAGCDGRGGGLRSQALCPVWLHVDDQVTLRQLQDAAGWLHGEVPDPASKGGITGTLGESLQW